LRAPGTGQAVPRAVHDPEAAQPLPWLRFPRSASRVASAKRMTVRVKGHCPDTLQPRRAVRMPSRRAGDTRTRVSGLLPVAARRLLR